MHGTVQLSKLNLPLKKFKYSTWRLILPIISSSSSASSSVWSAWINRIVTSSAMMVVESWGPFESFFDRPNLAQVLRTATCLDVRVLTKSKVRVVLTSSRLLVWFRAFYLNQGFIMMISVPQWLKFQNILDTISAIVSFPLQKLYNSPIDDEW